MAKIRIHELAKEIAEGNSGLDPKVVSADIMKLLQEKGVEVKSSSSSVSDEEAESIRAKYSGKPAKAAPKTDAPKKETAQKAEPKNEEPASKPAPASNAKPAQNAARPQGQAPAQGANKRPTATGVLRSRDGREIRYRVAQDGRLVNLADNSMLPFKMGSNGAILKLDGTPLMRTSGDNRAPQGQQRPAGTQQRPAQHQQPMNQVFDGRSERDKQRAANNAPQNRGQKGSLTNSLGDQLGAFASQIDPNNNNVVVDNTPKRKKADRDYTLPTLPDDFKTKKTAAEPEAPAQPETVAPAPVEAPVVTETPAEPVAPAAAPVVNQRPATEQRQGNEQRQNNEQRRPQNDRPQGERRDNRDGQNSSRPANRDGQRPYNRDGQNQGGYNRDGQRPYNRDGQGQGGYNRDGQRPYNRDGQGQGGYNRDGQRPYNRDGQGQGGFNRDGQRPFNRDGQGQGGFNRDGQRPFNRDGQGQGGFNRGGQGGFNRGGQGGFDKGGFGDKDKDDNNQRRTFTRKNDNRPTGGSAKSELANELGKNSRAESLKDRKNYKNNDKRDRADFDEDGAKKGSKKDPNRKGAFQKPVAKPVVEEEEIKTIEVGEVITIKELADKMKQPAAGIIKKLFLAGKMYNLNSEISFEEAEEIALDYEIICEKEVKVNVIEELLKENEEDPEKLVKRPPVVCVMGHVDHGKTSLLDAIRKTNVTAREAGGITQHIGAYMVEINGQKITFLDTPGHEAFTSMRMRGAQSTDIAILVVAADDGVMPQTVEAINHAKAAGVSIIVAVNKIDKPGANIDRVKQELTEHELVAEDWGGDTVMVPVSAKSGEGIENLLEMVLLTADVLELKANPDRNARGIVIEAKLDKGRGPVATVLVQKGTLNVGDNVVIGSVHGKVRAMVDDKGRKVKSATPSTPVELLGLNGVPQAGETMLSVADEKEARTIAEAYIAKSKEELIAESKKQITLENMFSQMHEGELKNLNLIIKADVMGSVEAVKQSLLKLTNEEVAVRVIHGGVGNINESDVNLAAASDAIIIGFNVKPDNTAKEISEREKVDVRLYRVIYDAIDDIELAMKGMLKPIYQEKVIAHAEVRQLFKASGVGTIAGSFVLDGKIQRGSMCRISRDGKQIWEGNLASLKRFKDDVKEVAAGYECGLVFEKYSDLAELDQVEFYIMEEIARS